MLVRQKARATKIYPRATFQRTGRRFNLPHECHWIERKTSPVTGVVSAPIEAQLEGAAPLQEFTRLQAYHATV